MAITLAKSLRLYIAIIDGSGTVIDAEPAHADADYVQAFEVACIVDCLATRRVQAIDRHSAILTASAEIAAEENGTGVSLDKPVRPFVAIVNGHDQVIGAEPMAAIDWQAFEVECIVHCLTTRSVDSIDRFSAMATARAEIAAENAGMVYTPLDRI
jgi:hypothetical protein